MGGFPSNPLLVNLSETPRRIRNPLVENIAQPYLDNTSSKKLFQDHERPNPLPNYLSGSDISHSRLSAYFATLPISLQPMRNDLLVVPQQPWKTLVLLVCQIPLEEGFGFIILS